jgi:hypothetical protein
MAQIKIKRTSGSSTPTGLTFGELAYVQGTKSIFIGQTGGDPALRLGAEVDSSTSLGTSDNKIPTQNAVKAYIDNNIAGGAVTSVDGVTGAVDISAGTGIGIGVAGKVITITNTGVQSLAGTSNQITVSGATGAVTLSLPSTVTVPGALNVTTNLTVTGNLTVNGTTTTVNSDSMTIDDPLLTLGTSGGVPIAASDGGKDRGIVFNYFDTAGRTGFFGYDASANEFVFLNRATVTNDVVTGVSYANVDIGQVLSFTNSLGTTDTITNFGSLGGASLQIPNYSGTITVFSGSEPNTNNYILKSNTSLGTPAAPTWIDPSATGFTAFTSTNVTTASDTSDAETFIAFVPLASATNQGIKYNSGLTYNAVTNSVKATTFVGALSGNATTATTATNATNVATTVDTTDVQAFLAFVPLASDTNQGVRYNSGLTYNAVSNSLTATTFVGALSGNSSTATILQTARNIGLTGDVSGSASFNGSADINITATIAANSVALGTDTTGNYVATLSTSSTGLSIANSGAESAAVTVDFATITSGLNMGTFSFASGEFTNSSGTVSLGVVDGGSY